MINILGFKRIVILLVLIALNAVLAASVYLYMAPETEKKERELRTLRSQTSTVQADIDRMQIEFDQFKEQQAQFEEYKKDGFFIRQDRRQIEDLFKLIQQKSGATAAAVAVNPATIEENKEAEKAEHKMLKSVIQIRLEALDDADVFHYIHLLEKFFPGHVTVEKIKFERAGEINGTVLRAIAGGQNFGLVKAEMELIWRTMVPASELPAEEGAKQ